MKIVLRKIKEIGLLTVLSFLLLGGTFRSETADALPLPTNQIDSLYMYNALENKVSVVETMKDNSPLFTDTFPMIHSVEGIEDTGVVHELTKEEVEEKLKEITVKHTTSMKEVEEAIDRINGIRTFVIGNNLGILKFQIVQIKGQIAMLEALALQTLDPTTKIQINDQAKVWHEEQIQVEKFVLERDDEFSLFGWLVTKL